MITTGSFSKCFPQRFNRNTRYSLFKDAEATLNAAFDFRDIVKVPAGEEEDDFIATNMVDFYNRAKLLYSTIADGNPNLKSG